MKVLDCESIESTYKSLENILGIKESRLHKLFDSVDIYDGSCSHIEPVQRLFSYVVSETQRQVDFDATYFFHCTRTRRGNEFEEGLLPLDQVIPRILDFLFELCREELSIGQSQFKTTLMNELRSVHTYDARIRSRHANGGPNAFLIRETTIEMVKSSTYWNYFKLPEIVDDICGCCPFKVKLRDKFITNTAPCIVKFKYNTDGKRLLSRALIYAYHKHRDLELSLACNGGFSGKGVPVPNDGSFKVEWPEGTNSD